MRQIAAIFFSKVEYIIMPSDKLVFDLSNEIEESVNVFVRKDWVNILDNQNGNYNANQSVIDTSQLSNSNKYMAYREAYLAVPLTLVLTNAAKAGANNGSFAPATGTKSADFAIGLKNWFGQIVHSMSLDFNGVTVIQQTQFSNMWNSFKLLTSLSWEDVRTQGPTMGFYPDDPLSFEFIPAAATSSGRGVCNNSNMRAPYNCLGVKLGKYVSGAKDSLVSATSTFNAYKSGLGNEGFLARQLYVNYDADASAGGSAYSGMLSTANATTLWKSYISTKQNGVNATSSGSWVCSIMAFIHLKHLHSFFSQIPLIKGAFMKLTLNLNNCSTSFSIAQQVEAVTGTTGGALTVNSVSVNIGGVNPIMIASANDSTIGSQNDVGQVTTQWCQGSYNLGSTAAGGVDYIVSLSVGQRCLNSTQTSLGVASTSGTLSSNIFLYVPAYTFNPVFEQAYISQPIKKVDYEDIYQYQINAIAANNQINSLVTNGIANVRSCLVLPFYSVSAADNLAAAGIPAYQSPFDPAGTGCTSPLALLTNFNVVVSGQNAIYNTERYSFEQFINQTYGCNAVNGGLTDGLTSSLINQLGWEMEYCYYYVDISRMLTVEQQVPKSVQIIGTNACQIPLDLFVFISYGCQLDFDILTGSRV